MHYKNGRAAKVGDSVIGLVNGEPVVGTVMNLGKSETCNLTIHSTQIVKTESIDKEWGLLANNIVGIRADGMMFIATAYSAYTAGDFLHAEDALKA